MPVHSIANVNLSGLEQVLADMKYVWFGLLHPHSLLETKGVLAVLGGGDSIKVLGTNPSHWELIYSDFSDVFDKPGTPLIKL